MKTVVFIHGMFMSPLCWEYWLPYFEAKGYAALAPAWPGRDHPVEALRAFHPDSQLGELTLAKIVEHHARFIRSLPEKPILIGHSMGGLIVQLLLQQDLALAGAAIDSAPPRGVFALKWSFFRANWPMLNPLIPKRQPRDISFRDFQYAFVNGLSLAEQITAYERYAVPESRQVPRDSLTRVGRVDFSKPHAPLLLTAGSADHIIPPAVNLANFRKYRVSGSITDFKEFPGRVHFGIGQKHWEEIADYILAWLKTQNV